MDYDKSILDDFKMIVSYLGTMLKTMQCKEGEHRWTDWNSHSDSSSRICWHCKAEMPDSKKGEKNYISQKMHTEKRLAKAKSEVAECERFLPSAKD